MARPASAAADEATAVSEASALLRELALPLGAIPSSIEPAGDGGYLGSPVLDGIPPPELVDEHAWWLLSGTPVQVLAYIREHLPAGATIYNSPPSQSGSTSAYALLRWPAGTGEIAERWLDLKVAQLPGGQSALRVDAQVLWVMPRTEIPPGARLLRVLVERPEPPRPDNRRRYTVTSRKRIGAVATLINSLPVARPSLLVRSCPAAFGALRLVFYRSAAAPPLAIAVVSAGGCGGVELSVDGRAQPTLSGDGFSTIGRIAGDLRLTLAFRPRNNSLGPHADTPKAVKT